MAWGNIDNRRLKVKSLLAEGVAFKTIKKVCCVEFGCSPSAIDADIHAINGNTAHISSVIRQRIRNRDNYTCQYCGIQHPNSGIIDHVVPFALGGCKHDYNLVFSCQRCNAEKGRRTWIPDNLEVITRDNPEWKVRIISMARNT